MKIVDGGYVNVEKSLYRPNTILVTTKDRESAVTVMRCTPEEAVLIAATLVREAEAAAAVALPE